MNGWICLLLMFLFRAFYCIQMNPLCKFYSHFFGKNYLVDSDVLNKYVIQYRQRRSWSQSTSFVNEMFHKLAYQQIWYPRNGILGVNAIFCNRSQGFLKRCIDNASSLLFWGYSLLHNFIIFPPYFFFIFLLLPNFIILPPPIPPPHFLCIFFHSRLHRPYINPRLNLFFQHSFVNSETIYDHHHIFSLQDLHHHHISVVFTPPIVFPQTGQFGQPQAKIAKNVKKGLFL